MVLRNPELHARNDDGARYYNSVMILFFNSCELFSYWLVKKRTARVCLIVLFFNVFFELSCFGTVCCVYLQDV